MFSNRIEPELLPFVMLSNWLFRFVSGVPLYMGCVSLLGLLGPIGVAQAHLDCLGSLGAEQICDAFLSL